MILDRFKYRQKVFLLLSVVFIIIMCGLFVSYGFFVDRILESHKIRLENSSYLTSVLIKEKQDEMLRHVIFFQNNRTIIEYLYISTVLKGSRDPLIELIKPIYVSQKIDVIKIYDIKGKLSVNFDTVNGAVESCMQKVLPLDEMTSGFCRIGENVTIFSVGPLRHNDVAVGYVLLGKYVDGEFLSEISDITWSDLLFVREDTIKASSTTVGEIPYAPKDGKLSIDGHVYSIKEEMLKNPKDDELGRVVTALDDSELNKSLSSLKLYIIIIFGFSAVVSFGLSLLLIRALVKPVDNMVQVIEEVGKGDYEHKIDVRGRDEIAMLAERFNYMQGKLKEQRDAITKYTDNLEYLVEERTKELDKVQRQLIQAQKMESLGTLAGGLAHDFNNLLAAILGYASFVNEDIDENHPHYKYWDIVEQAALRGAELTGHLLTFARTRVESTVKKPVEINELIREMLSLLKRTIEKNIRLDAKLKDQKFYVNGDSSAMYQAFLNICINARDAMPSGGRLVIETEIFKADEDFLIGHMKALAGSYVRVNITDNGVGMRREVVERIFEPFYTTKGAGRGTGLGLAIVYSVINQHSGFLDVYSEPGKGTTFKIYLPAYEQEVALEKEEDVVLEAERPDITVLVVDDEDPLRRLCKEILESAKYQVITAQNGFEAINLYELKKDSINLVLLDMIMPDLSGHETLRKLRVFNPDIKVLISSGFSREIEIKWAEEKGVAGFIEKPYRYKSLLKKVKQALKSDVS